MNVKQNVEGVEECVNTCARIQTRATCARGRVSLIGHPSDEWQRQHQQHHQLAQWAAASCQRHRARLAARDAAQSD